MDLSDGATGGELVTTLKTLLGNGASSTVARCWEFGRLAAPAVTDPPDLMHRDLARAMLARRLGVQASFVTACVDLYTRYPALEVERLTGRGLTWAAIAELAQEPDAAKRTILEERLAAGTVTAAELRSARERAAKAAERRKVKAAAKAAPATPWSPSRAAQSFLFAAEGFRNGCDMLPSSIPLTLTGIEKSLHRDRLELLADLEAALRAADLAYRRLAGDPTLQRFVGDAFADRPPPAALAWPDYSGVLRLPLTGAARLGYRVRPRSPSPGRQLREWKEQFLNAFESAGGLAAAVNESVTKPPDATLSKPLADGQTALVEAIRAAVRGFGRLPTPADALGLV